MTISSGDTVSAYHDIASMTSLRGRAKADPDSAIREVASQFESMVLSMMLKSARETVIDGGLFESSAMDTYESMFDNQVAMDIAAQGGIGLADIIARQLSVSDRMDSVKGQAPGDADA